MIDEYTSHARKKFVGASDAPAIVGVSSHRTAWDVWAEKTGKLEARPRNDAMEAGTYFEGGILDWLANRLKTTISRDQFTVSEDGVRCANLDGIILSGAEAEIVETKTCGLFGPSGWAAEWGDPEAGEDGVPSDVLVQVNHAMDVAGEAVGRPIELAHVAVFIGGGPGFRHYRVRPSPELQDAVRTQVRRFWAEHVRAGLAPRNSKPSLAVAKALIRTQGKSAPIPGDVVGAWIDARDARLAAEKIEDAKAAEMLREMGDAEIGVTDYGTVYYRLHERKGYTVGPTQYRKLAFKKATHYIAARPQKELP